MFATNNRRRPGDNDDCLGIINDHGGSLHLVPNYSFVQEEHGRGVYASDFIKVYTVSGVWAGDRDRMSRKVADLGEHRFSECVESFSDPSYLKL